MIKSVYADVFDRLSDVAFVVWFLLMTSSSVDGQGSWPTDCRVSQAGTEYNGTVNVTMSGIQCLQWTSASWFNGSFADGSASQAKNFCRNTLSAMFVGGVWCLTGNNSQPWEYCNVPLCGESTAVIYNMIYMIYDIYIYIYIYIYILMLYGL